MWRAISRSVLIGAATIVAAGAVAFANVRFFCTERQAWVHAHTGEPVVRLSHPYRVPRRQDAIFVCETPHRVGPLVLHTDLYCVCAPPSTPIAPLALAVGEGTTCTLKSPATDDPVLARACAPAYCDEHIDLDAAGRRIVDAQPR